MQKITNAIEDIDPLSDLFDLSTKLDTIIDLLERIAKRRAYKRPQTHVKNHTDRHPNTIGTLSVGIEFDFLISPSGQRLVMVTGEPPEERLLYFCVFPVFENSRTPQSNN